jgi:phospholipid/cholesterol/gamma-HCH transport system substrate-binding protein
VKGNLVKVGGVTVGSVKSIDLTDHNNADLTLKITDGKFSPLHRGTTATIRNSSLSAVAGREIALVPGPNNAPKIDDGGTIPLEDTQPIVDLDAVLNTLDLQTRDALQGIVHGSAITYAKNTEAGRRGLEYLNPALSRTAAFVSELDKDKRAFAKLILTSATVVNTVAAKQDDLLAGVANASTAANAVAREAASLDTALKLAPATLRRGDSALVNLRGALGDVKPALALARPVAPRLAHVLRILAPLAREARTPVADTRALLPSLTAALKGLPSLSTTATKSFGSSTAALRGTAPIGAAARPYTPDLIAGLVNGFGGLQAGYYDANGHYARLSANASPRGANGLLSTLPGFDQNSPPPFNSFRTHITHRCPGAATQTAPDKSSPYAPDEAQCDTKDNVP